MKRFPEITDESLLKIATRDLKNLDDGLRYLRGKTSLEPVTPAFKSWDKSSDEEKAHHEAWMTQARIASWVFPDLHWRAAIRELLVTTVFSPIEAELQRRRTLIVGALERYYDARKVITP